MLKIGRVVGLDRSGLKATLDVRFCLEAWRAALEAGTRWPLIANTDPGSQFTATDYLEAVEAAGTRVSMPLPHQSLLGDFGHLRFFDVFNGYQ
jgi:hypothetical protein